MEIQKDNKNFKNMAETKKNFLAKSFKLCQTKKHRVS